MTWGISTMKPADSSRSIICGSETVTHVSGMDLWADQVRIEVTLRIHSGRGRYARAREAATTCIWCPLVIGLLLDAAGFGYLLWCRRHHRGLTLCHRRLPSTDHRAGRL